MRKGTLAALLSLSLVAAVALSFHLRAPGRHPPPSGSSDGHAPPPASSSRAEASALAAQSDPSRDREVDADEYVQPHPSTPAHETTAAQQALLGAVEAALDAADVTRARELLRQHSVRFAGDAGWHDLRVAYELIAVCIEQPGPESRLRGQRFVDEQRGSPLRRRVRRACLGER